MPKNKRASSKAGSSAGQPAAKRSNVDVEVVGDPLAVGINCFGQCGVGDHLPERKKPAHVKKGSLADQQVIDVAAGGMHTAFVDSRHRVHTFGCNDEGALGRAAPDDGEYLAAEAEGLEDVTVIKVTAGDSHTAVLDDQGYVYATGCFRDDDGSLAFSDQVLLQKSFVRVFPTEEMIQASKTKVRGRVRPLPLARTIASGADHVLILTTDGSLFSMGTGKQGQLGRISERFSVRDSARDVGNESSEEIRKKKTTVQFLRRVLIPQQITTRGFKNIVFIGTGTWSSFAIDSKGQVWAWGLNNHHQLGVPRSDKATFEAEANCVFQPSKATLWDGLDIVEVVGGQHHSIARSKDGKVYGLGRGDCGRLGNQSDEDQHTPVHIASLDDKQIVSVATASAASYALSKNGKGYAWGFGENLQLTNGEEEDAPTPIEMTGKQLETRGLFKVSGGGQHSAMIAKAESEA